MIAGSYRRAAGCDLMLPDKDRPIPSSTCHQPLSIGKATMQVGEGLGETNRRPI